MTLLVLDRGEPVRQNQTMVHITLEDMNDEPPVILDSPDVKISEGAAVNTSVTNITATDPDTDHRLYYTLLLDQSKAYNDRDLDVDVQTVAVSIDS